MRYTVGTCLLGRWQDELALFTLTIAGMPQPGVLLRVTACRASEVNDESFFWLHSFEQPVRDR